MQNLRNKTLGAKGEEIAANYLHSLGFKVIERNFHKRYTELDIVALDNKTLVFIEVKTRIGKKYGTAEEAITPWKLRNLIRSAHYYKLLHPDLPDAMRIDVVSIILSSQQNLEKISLYKNVTGF